MSNSASARSTDTTLSVSNLRVGYGGEDVIQGMSLKLAAGEMVALVGRNGIGKTTLMRAVAGEIRVNGGSVMLLGQDITGLPTHKRHKLGLMYIPEGGGVISALTVREHFRLCQSNSPEDIFDQRMTLARGLFPSLSERLDQYGSALSGGERQILSITLAYLFRPKLLLMDEPTSGLSPSNISKIGDLIALVKSETSILASSQNDATLKNITDRTLAMQFNKVTAISSP